MPALRRDIRGGGRLLGLRHRVAAVSTLGARTLVAFLLATILAAQAPLADIDARTTAPTTLRAKPDISARAVAQLPAETVVHIMGCENDWCQVVVRRRVGYVSRGVLAAMP
ncbi:MAG: SH3 domain-containing protein, partial [Gemmatimonadales bacterium]